MTDAQFEIDVYWVQSGGADPLEWIRKVAGRMKKVAGWPLFPDQRFA